MLLQSTEHVQQRTGFPGRKMTDAHMWHSIGKGPIWSFLETETLRKTGEMVKKLKKIIFLILAW